MRIICSNGLVYDSNNYLSHHGIQGQKWGKKNGPPYPLSAGAHSSAEKKTMYGNSDQPKKDSDNRSALGFAAVLALNIVTLNPVGLAMNTKRLIDYGHSKTNEALEKARTEKLTIDKKTGFRLKDRDFTPEEDMKHINPGYKNFNANTKNNCMLCTTAYELRRRGYDVHAGFTTTGYQSNEALKWFPKAKMETAYSPSSDSKKAALERARAELGLNSGKDKYKQLSDTVLKHGNGARGNLMVTWAGGSGHSVVWENRNGNFVIRDCQSNKTYSKPAQIRSLLSTTTSAQVVRTDNVDFDLKAIQGYFV